VPIYEYECEKCGRVSEFLIRSSEDKPECPDCGSAKLERRLSTFAAHGGGAKPQPSDCRACDNFSCPAARR